MIDPLRLAWHVAWRRCSTNGPSRLTPPSSSGGRPMLGGVEDRPTAGELLQAVATLLDDEVLPAVDDSLTHKVRVAANLCRIVDREIRLGPGNIDRERKALQAILGRDGTLAELNERLATTLRDADDAFVAQAADALLPCVVDKLAVDKPGYPIGA